MNIFINNFKKFVIFLSIFSFTVFFSSSIAVNILNQANENINTSFYDYFLLFILFFLFLNLFFHNLNLDEFLYEFDEFYLENKKKLIAVISAVLSIIIIIIMKFSASLLIDNKIYDDTAKNIANLYASNQYYNSSLIEKERYKNVYQFKQDLLDEIVLIENKKININDATDIQNNGLNPLTDFKEYSFWHILSILILTDDKLMNKYSGKIEELHKIKVERELKEQTDKLYILYSEGYSTAKKDFEDHQKKYNEQVKYIKSIDHIIDKDLKELNKIKLNTKDKFQFIANSINKDAIKWANDFTINYKNGIIEQLYRIKGKKPNGSKCSKSCQDSAVNKYNKYYGNKIGKKYDYWLAVGEKTITNQALEEGVKLLLSKGTSLLFQLKPGHLEKNKKTSYIETSDTHFIILSKNIFIENKANGKDGLGLSYRNVENNPNIKELFVVVKQDYIKTDLFKINVIKDFKNKKGYTLNENDIYSDKSFKEKSKKHYSSLIKNKINKPIFNDFLKNDKYQEIIQNNLGRLYSKFIPIDLNNKELVDKFLKEAMEKEIKRKENSINYKEAYKKMIYPYIMLSFISFIFILSTIYFLIKLLSFFIQGLSNKFVIILTIIIFSLFMIRINYYDLSKSTDIKSAKEISRQLSERNFLTNLSINTIMYAYPIFINIENFKNDIYLFIFSDGIDSIEKTKKITKN